MDVTPPLPAPCRPAGYVLTVLGALLAVARFHFGAAPDFAEVRLFAVCSVFFETRYLAPIAKNATGEVAALLALSGLALAVLAREANEDAALGALRLRALLFALGANAALLALSLFLFFGVAFVWVLVANMYSTPALYLLAYRGQLWRRRAGDTPGLGGGAP